MANQYYLKDKKIQLWEYTEKRVNGVVVKTWVKATEGKIWAYYRQTGGSKTLEGSAVKYYNSVEDCIFIVNKRSDIALTTALRIVYNHKIYVINVVDDYDGNVSELKISAKLNDDQNFNTGDNVGILDE